MLAWKGEEKSRKRLDAFDKVAAAENEIERKQDEEQKAAGIEPQQGDERPASAGCGARADPCQQRARRNLQYDADGRAGELRNDIIDCHRAPREKQLEIFHR